VLAARIVPPHQWPLPICDVNHLRASGHAMSCKRSQVVAASRHQPSVQPTDVLVTSLPYDGVSRRRYKTGMGKQRFHYLERDTEDGPYIRARLDVERNGLTYTEIFEIEEPVHLRTIRLCPKVDECKNAPKVQEDEIWWIKGFSHAQGVASVYVATKRGGELGDYTIPVNELVKVPAMLRIALACSD